MLRVNIDALINEGGVFFYKNELFTGIAFTVEDGDILDASEYSKGIRAGKYVNPYFPSADSLQSIDLDFLEGENEEDYQPRECYKGKLFSGIALEFEGDFCTSESLYIRGWCDSDVTYFKSGELETLTLIEDGFSQIYHWYENGKIKKFKIHLRDTLAINLVFDEEERITTFSLEGDYFSKIKAIEDKIKFPMFNDESFITDLKSAENFLAIGSSVNDQLFEKMYLGGGLKAMKKLSALRISITSKTLRWLVSCPNIKALDIEADGISYDNLQEFKSNRPDCTIRFNRKAL